ncbi:PREDICTED: uncharacterized protein LOC109173060 [Ipomoea nil]|uniref:uncharacterized protein LOC109173060 n=1 Tax=Ipomoea nil TaxID=35883 RepID=UPI000901BF6B|nr:PREDICTED: uncharacterized protein LOC109173060 [Ipomoea nil]
MADPSLFTKTSGSSFTALLIYVDDILIAGNCKPQINELKEFLDKSLRIKDLGHLNFFLGIEAVRTADGISLFQRKYTLEILKENGFLEAKPASTPATTGLKLVSSEGVPLDNPEIYRRLIGKLLYLTNTRPDISHVVQQLSQFVDMPTNIHLTAAHRVLRYLKGSPGKGLFYHANSHVQLKRFSDSDWANCIESRMSITGFCIYLADLSVKFDVATPLFCDNLSAIAIGENHVFHERTKHIEIDCHIVKQKVHEGLIKLLPVSSQKQIADGFTKALPKPAFETFHSKLGIHDIHVPAYGGC